jgi:DNA repair exonuclease SbcCD ATPase subunit
LKIITLYIEGFCSFRDPTVIQFPKQAGLFHIRGENKAEPALGGNAVGKSTLSNAICWCFYGKNARGLSGPSVESWDKAKTDVRVVLELGGSQVEVRRTRKPNNLYLGSEIVDQGVVDDLLNLTYERFLQCVLLGQFGVLFPDMKPTARLDLISQVLDLELWSGASLSAKEKLSSANMDIQNKEKSIHGLGERRFAVNKHLESYDSLVADWQRTQEQSIAWEEAELGELETSVRGLVLDEGKASKKLEATKEKLSEAELAASSARKRHSRERENFVQRRAEWDASKKDWLRAKEALHGLQEQSEDSCPLCGQQIDRSQLDVLVSKAESSLEEARLVMESTSDLNLQAKKEAERMQSCLAELREAESRASKAHGDAASLHREIVAELKQQRSDLRRCETKLAGFVAETNPHESGRESIQDTLDELTDKIEEEQVFLYDSVTNHGLLQDWPKLFKELRLWLVEQALDELEIHVNSSLIELGLHDWSISFSVERETKSGTVSRGFDILVMSPMSPEGVPWESWSGGETQRLRVACAAGIAELIRSRTLADPFFEIWDEPTAHLDENGVQDLIAYFGARSDQRQIWIVDHRSLDSGAFDGSLTVVKDEKGSHVELWDQVVL